MSMTPEQLAEIRAYLSRCREFSAEWGEIHDDCEQMLGEIERLQDHNVRLLNLNAECMQCLGYAITARRENTESWMNGLVERLNAVLALDGDEQFAMRRGDGIRLVKAEDASHDDT